MKLTRICSASLADDQTADLVQPFERRHEVVRVLRLRHRRDALQFCLLDLAPDPDRYDLDVIPTCLLGLGNRPGGIDRRFAVRQNDRDVLYPRPVASCRRELNVLHLYETLLRVRSLAEVSDAVDGVDQVGLVGVRVQVEHTRGAVAEDDEADLGLGAVRTDRQLVDEVGDELETTGHDDRTVERCGNCYIGDGETQGVTIMLS